MTDVIGPDLRATLKSLKLGQMADTLMGTWQVTAAAHQGHELSAQGAGPACLIHACRHPGTVMPSGRPAGSGGWQRRPGSIP